MMPIRQRVTNKISILAKIALVIIFLSVVLIVVSKLNKREISKLNKREMVPSETEYSKKVIVQANHYGLTPTGINLSPGDIIEIKASGKIKWDSNSKEPVVGPSGASWWPEHTGHSSDFFWIAAPVASLIGIVNDDLYEIGSWRIILVEESGELMFTINEDWRNKSAWQDNKGAFIVEVNILRKVSKYTPLADRPIREWDYFKIRPNNSWHSTKFYVPDNSLLTLELSSIRRSKRIWDSKIPLENAEEYKNQKLYLNYKIGAKGAEHTITILDITEEKYEGKTFREIGEGGELFIKCIDKNYKNDRYWEISVWRYTITEEEELLSKGAFADKGDIYGFEWDLAEGRPASISYSQHIYPSGKWYATRLTIPSNCVLWIGLAFAFDKKLGGILPGESESLNYRKRYKGITDLKGKLELLYQVGENGKVHNIHTHRGEPVLISSSPQKISRGGGLYISGKDENYKNDRLWQIYIRLDKIKKYSINLKKLRNSDYREFE